MRTSSPCLRVPVAAEVSRRINKAALVWRRRSARVAPRPDTSCRDGAIKFMEIDSDTEYRQARARALGRANKHQLKTEGRRGVQTQTGTATHTHGAFLAAVRRKRIRNTVCEARRKAGTAS